MNLKMNSLVFRSPLIFLTMTLNHSSIGLVTMQASLMHMLQNHKYWWKCNLKGRLIIAFNEVNVPIKTDYNLNELFVSLHSVKLENFISMYIFLTTQSCILWSERVGVLSYWQIRYMTVFSWNMTHEFMLEGIY